MSDRGERVSIHLTIIEVGEEIRSLSYSQEHVGLGRESSNEVVLVDPFISGQHAEVVIEEGRIIFRDLHSTNGSRIRRNRWLVPVDHRCGHETALQDGDEILLGHPARPVCLRASIVSTSRRALEDDQVLEHAVVASLQSSELPDLPERFNRDALLALQDLATCMRSTMGLDDLVRVLAGRLLAHFSAATHVSVFLEGSREGEYRPTLSRSRTGDVGHEPLSRTIREEVVSGTEAVAFAGDASKSLHESSIQSGLCAPLWNGTRIIGLVQLEQRNLTGKGFGRTELEVFAVFAYQAALVIEIALAHASLQATMEESVRGMVQVIETQETPGVGHSLAVAELGDTLARTLGLAEPEIQILTRAALLHGIGKLGLSGEVSTTGNALSASGESVEAGRRLLDAHPEVGAGILESFEFMADLVPIVRHQGERWDGEGRPSGLAGKDIPIGARILAVADCFNALISDTPDSPGKDVETALKLMELERGKRFDPQVFAALDHLMSEQGEAATGGEDPIIGDGVATRTEWAGGVAPLPATTGKG